METEGVVTDRVEMSPERVPVAALLRAAGMAGCVAFIGISLTAWRSYPGTFVSFAAFNLVFLGLLALIFPKPRLYCYTVLAVFLALGFWAKLAVHLLTGSAFVEPVGRFDGSPELWDSALNAATAGATGILAIRLAHWAICCRRGRSGDFVEAPGIAPTWYIKSRVLVWLLVAGAGIALNLWNYTAAYYQIGVNPRLVLPFHLNVLTGWLISNGFAIAFATLFYWEISFRPSNIHRVLVAPFIEALMASASALSRSLYLFHAAPYIFAWIEERTKLRPYLGRKALGIYLAIFATGLVASLFLVQALRSTVYFEDTRLNAEQTTNAPESPVPSVNSGRSAVRATQPPSYFIQLLKQLPWLVVHRWVGLEGVLAVAAYPAKNPNLLIEAATENPRRGHDSIYQRIAGGQYTDSSRFTFLTLAGVVAILFYAGWWGFVFAGMTLLMTVMIATELLAKRVTGNPYLLAYIGFALANVVCQLNFPYLGGIFLAQLWVAIAFLGLLSGGARKAV